MLRRQGRATRHTHDYKRNGVVDLYAALELATGQVTHALTNSHTAADFLSFMKKVDRAYSGAELHVILDNSSSHSTLAVKARFVGHPNVHFNYTPTSASWMNEFLLSSANRRCSRRTSSRPNHCAMTFRKFGKFSQSSAAASQDALKASNVVQQMRTSSYAVAMRCSSAMHLALLGGSGNPRR